ncbi:transcription factor kayak isoform X1 [Rhopalosiphum padi]|uniref:transcription factor kayak isoform X1 n=1 Tax=Rhopalosiphum padi TaxID=40932 RepID=UPI00298E378A|nr:transcription factor kayak isoform X1 [Rhopalosiphum padi]
MLQPAQMVPSSDIYNDSSSSVCRDCLDPVGLCTCSWQIMQLDASYSIYTTLNDDTTKRPPSTTSSFFSDLQKLDGLNCGGIPTRTTPTLTPTTLRTIAADIASLSPGPPENFATAASDLHHLVSSSCSTINTSTLGASDRTDLQEHVTIQNLSNQTISLQSLNNQHINLNNVQNHPNSLNQQQRNEYNNSFSTAASRQAGFVPPLVLQINSSNPSAQQSSGSTILLNNNSSGASSIFSAKGSSTSASSSHWQGVVVTQRPQNRARSVTKRQFTDDEEGDDDYDSAADDGTDSSDTTSGKMTRKQNTKNNKSNSKNSIKSEFKNNTASSGGGRRTNNKDNKTMSAEEEQRRQVRRERNKLAAARCRKRRMDHTNELLEETGQLEDKRMRLQVEIEGLRQQKTDLQQMLAQHKCAVNMNNVQLSNSITSVNQATILDSNEISETKPIVLSNHLSSIKGIPLQQNISTNIVISDNDSNNVDDIIIKHEDNSIIQTEIDSKDSINIIPTSVMQQSHRRRPTTLLQLNNGNFGNNKKISENGSTGVVVLNFDSLMDGGTGLTPVASSGGSVQNHHQQVQHSSTGNGGVNTDNNSVLS